MNKYDIDYYRKLNPADRAWLFTFLDEYERAYFNRAKSRLHHTHELYKDCNDRRNRYRRDILNVCPIETIDSIADDTEL